MTTYSVFRADDSSIFESALSLEESTKEFWSKNGTVRNYHDALYLIATDDDFAKIAAGEEIRVTPVKPLGWQA